MNRRSTTSSCASSPGVPERLLTLEGRLQRVEYQVQPNGGESAYDAMRLAVAELDAKVDSYHGAK